MPVSTAREPFIPVRVHDLVDVLCHDTGPAHDRPLADDDQAAFRAFAETAAERAHHRYLRKLRELKADYAPFDPDADWLALAPEGNDRTRRLDDLFERFADLLAFANYRRLTRRELEEIMQGASRWGVDMRVEWEAFEKVDVYVRGLGEGTRFVRKWYRLFRKQAVSVPTFSRVVIILKQRPHKALGSGADTRNVFLKLFKDIPRMDVEMLLPGTTIRMAMLDRLRLGGSGLGSLGWVMYKLLGLLTPMLKAVGLVATGAVVGEKFGEEGLVALLAFYTPLALIGGYAYKTYASYATTRKTYQLQLSQSLYYQNLDNNAGVLYRLLNTAEEQEAREMLLAYFGLWRYAGGGGWTAAELDEFVEAELRRRVGVEVNFDVQRAVATLERVGVVLRENARLRVLPPAEAKQMIDAGWDAG
jgi:hypothetical protein